MTITSSITGMELSIVLSKGDKIMFRNSENWMVCEHVLDGTALEVWISPDQMALCKNCFQQPRVFDELEDLEYIEYFYLLEVLERVNNVRGRKYLQK